MRVQSFLTGAALFHRVTVGGNTLWGGARAPDGIFDVVLTIWVPARLNPSWRSPLLPGHAYPASELSWRLGIFP
jgi:hypothetical protein